MKTIKIPNETFEFLAYVARQDVARAFGFVGAYAWTVSKSKCACFSAIGLEVALHRLEGSLNSTC
jgi:hypothetical protein